MRDLQIPSSRAICHFSFVIRHSPNLSQFSAVVRKNVASRTGGANGPVDAKGVIQAHMSRGTGRYDSLLLLCRAGSRFAGQASFVFTFLVAAKKTITAYTIRNATSVQRTRIPTPLRNTPLRTVTKYRDGHPTVIALLTGRMAAMV